jgi:hypothetical protein
MKKLLFFFTTVIALSANAQQPKDTSAPYLRNQNIPPIKIITAINGTDTTWFTNDNLPKIKP